MTLADRYTGENLWEIDLWDSPVGVCYVETEFLDDLYAQDRRTYDQLFKKMDYYRKYPFRRLPSDVIEPLGQGLYEVRFKMSSEIRFLGVVTYEASSPIFHVLCAFSKKTRKIPKRYIKLARTRQKEFDLMQKEKK